MSESGIFCFESALRFILLDAQYAYTMSNARQQLRENSHTICIHNFIPFAKPINSSEKNACIYGHLISWYQYSTEPGCTSEYTAIHCLGLSTQFAIRPLQCPIVEINYKRLLNRSSVHPTLGKEFKLLL